MRSLEESLEACIKAVCPIGNLRYAHTRSKKSENEIEREGDNEKEGVRTEECIISISSPHKCSILTEPHKRKRATTVTTNDHLLKNVPDPSNGSEYSPREVITMLNSSSKKQRALYINELIERKLVPVQRAAIYKLIKRTHDEENEAYPSSWNRKGRPPILSNTQVSNVCDQQFASHGHALTVCDITAALKN